MADNDSQKSGTQTRPSLEFWLVVAMLIALCVLVAAVLFWPITPFTPQVTGKEVSFKEILEYRTNILSVIITAFGAWVGAGAAYFFGRENLRVAADSILAMRETSPRERLRQTSVKQIPPTPIDWTVKQDTLVADVSKKLTDEPARWFVPVVDNDGKLQTVINEEGVWRFLLDPQRPTAGSQTETVKDLVGYIDNRSDLKERFKGIYVSVTMETTVGAANDLMDSKKVFLAIVESEGKPTHYFTTSEVRKLLLQGGQSDR
jgi:hypothetical protein